MTRQWLAIVMGFVLLGASPVFARGQEAEETELWTGTIYTSSFRCGFCTTKSGKARGVLLLKTVFGQVDEYHLYGTMRDGHLDVRHSSGHHVKGKIVSSTRVKGTITLGSGKTIAFKGKRKTGVRLKFSDCAPLN